MVECSTSSGCWASLCVHCNTLTWAKWPLTSTITVPRPTIKDQKLGGGPIPGDLCPFPKIVEIILLLIVLCCAKSLSRVWLFVIPWAVAHQAPLSMGIFQASILGSVAIPSSREFLTLRYQTQVSCISGRFFTNWVTREATHSFIQFSSVESLSRVRLCDTMDCSTAGFRVHHQLPEFTQTNIHWVIDAIQPSHPLSSPSPPAFNLSQNQGLFKWVHSSHQVDKVLEFQLHHQSFQWIFRTDFL